MTQGQIVVCRDFRSEPLVRRVWNETQEKVYIHDEHNYEMHLRGNDFLEPVGFPVEDVFVYEPGMTDFSWPRMTLAIYDKGSEVAEAN